MNLCVCLCVCCAYFPAPAPQIDGNTGYRTKCMLTMPILDSKGHSLAVMQFLNKNGGVFSREDFDMLRALCAQTSMAIQVFDSQTVTCIVES